MRDIVLGQSSTEVKRQEKQVETMHWRLKEMFSVQHEMSLQVAQLAAEIASLKSVIHVTGPAKSLVKGLTPAEPSSDTQLTAVAQEMADKLCSGMVESLKEAQGLVDEVCASLKNDVRIAVADRPARGSKTKTGGSKELQQGDGRSWPDTAAKQALRTSASPTSLRDSKPSTAGHSTRPSTSPEMSSSSEPATQVVEC
eukprot:TRINITY_DN24627_c0_g1_i1.p1 TRINITY_DN24627_c0_g1~~TRINITY_DN24627_c0_g1_i1.p1  ORF type:complete len:213 (+),score=46.57 TRINITY_DN24627_c0_g1_i1:47-640(+)